MTGFVGAKGLCPVLLERRGCDRFCWSEGVVTGFVGAKGL